MIVVVLGSLFLHFCSGNIALSCIGDVVDIAGAAPLIKTALTHIGSDLKCP